MKSAAWAQREEPTPRVDYARPGSSRADWGLGATLAGVIGGLWTAGVDREILLVSVECLVLAGLPATVSTCIFVRLGELRRGGRLLLDRGSAAGLVDGLLVQGLRRSMRWILPTLVLALACVSGIGLPTMLIGLLWLLEAGLFLLAAGLLAQMAALGAHLPGLAIVCATLAGMVLPIAAFGLEPAAALIFSSTVLGLSTYGLRRAVIRRLELS
ncbi:MAG: hypothetical protein HY319_10675 [Armatimonadetes bacterium]|nr:hypothetical protein [Armatimonadota bacterium]